MAREIAVSTKITVLPSIDASISAQPITKITIMTARAQNSNSEDDRTKVVRVRGPVILKKAIGRALMMETV